MAHNRMVVELDVQSTDMEIKDSFYNALRSLDNIKVYPFKDRFKSKGDNLYEVQIDTDRIPETNEAHHTISITALDVTKPYDKDEFHYMFGRVMDVLDNVPFVNNVEIREMGPELTDRIAPWRDTIDALENDPSDSQTERSKRKESKQTDRGTRWTSERGYEEDVCFTPEFTKDEAGYREHTEMDAKQGLVPCADCIHYVPDAEVDGEPTHGCQLVRGEIDENGVCDHSAVACMTADNNGDIKTYMYSEEIKWGASTIREYAEKMKDEMSDLLGVRL